MISAKKKQKESFVSFLLYTIKTKYIPIKGKESSNQTSRMDATGRNIKESYISENSYCSLLGACQIL